LGFSQFATLPRPKNSTNKILHLPCPPFALPLKKSNRRKNPSFTQGMVFSAALPGTIPKGVESGVFFFWGQFCDIRKVAINHSLKILARFWLQAK
jgi:hypothetical protein